MKTTIFQTAALDMAGQYGRLSLEGLGLSDYAHRYVSDYRSNPDALAANWLRSAHIIATALRHADAEPSSTCLIDCGGGQGLLSLLAVRLGFGQVVYSDLGAQMTCDAQAIGQRMGMLATHYVAGDLSAVARALHHDRSSTYIVVSSNVIEHVYDLNDLWDACTELAADRRFTAVWCSDANSANPFISSRRRRTHRFFENIDRTASNRDSELDSTSSFASLRRRLIEPLLPEKSCHELDRLTAATRGLHAADIQTAVRQFLQDGRLVQPEHPTNTCNPETGNWCERLIDLNATRSQLQGRGWQVHVEPGFYGPRSGLARQAAVSLLNRAIALASPHSLAIAPVYQLVMSLPRQPAPMTNQRIPDRLNSA